MRTWALVVACTLWTSTARADATDELIGYGELGVVVRNTTTSVEGIDVGAYDPALGLLWFVAGDKLYVLDLRVASSKPVVIAERWPAIQAFAVTGTSVAEAVSDRGGLRYPILSWGSSVKVKASGGKARYLSKAEDKAAKKAIKRIKIVGKKWLKKHRKRKARKVTRPGAALADEVVIPAELSHCDAPKLCGHAYSLLGDFQLVVVSGGELPVRCVLYDPAGGQFADPTPLTSASWGDANNPSLEAGPCLGYAVDGARYQVELGVYTVTKQGVTLDDHGSWNYVGWVDDSIASR